MMKYDVFYLSREDGSVAFDSDRQLPLSNVGVWYAHNTNGDGHYLIPEKADWRKVSRREALKS